MSWGPKTNPKIESILTSFKAGNQHLGVLEMLNARIDPIDFFVYISEKIDYAFPDEDIKIYKYFDDPIFAAKVTEQFWMIHKWKDWEEVDAEMERDRDRRLGIVNEYLDPSGGPRYE